MCAYLNSEILWLCREVKGSKKSIEVKARMDSLQTKNP